MSSKITCFLLFFLPLLTQAQNGVGIGTNTPNTSALLDITATNKGVLVPRVTNIQMIAIASPANGLLVYNTDSAAFAYRIVSTWVFLKGNTTVSNDWSTRGNAGTDVLKNFIGTTDNMDLIFKRNNQLAGMLSEGRSNTSWGVGAFNPLSLSFYNTAIGYQSLGNVTLGRNNVGTGYQSLYNNLGGAANAATGYQSLYSNQFGAGNSANGASALYSNINGYSNVAVGVEALFKNTERSNLVAVGDSALYNNGTGATIAGQATRNTATGSKALFSNTRGSSNTANGYRALFSNNTGGANSAYGSQALSNNSNGFYNTAIGNLALLINSSGSENTVVGYTALTNNSDGSQNTVIGSVAGFNSNGSGNVFLGYNAGYNETGSNKLYITNDSTDAANTLIYGEFDNKLLQVNGRLKVNVPETTVGLDLGAAAIKVSGINPAVFTVEATAAEVDLLIPNTGMANSSTDILIITHKLTSNKLNTSPGVYWNGSNWVIFLENFTNHIVGEKFNVMVIKQ